MKWSATVATLITLCTRHFWQKNAHASQWNDGYLGEKRAFPRRPLSAAFPPDCDIQAAIRNVRLSSIRGRLAAFGAMRNCRKESANAASGAQHKKSATGIRTICLTMCLGILASFTLRRTKLSLQKDLCAARLLFPILTCKSNFDSKQAPNQNIFGAKYLLQ
jgi:hypothetical protein